MGNGHIMELSANDITVHQSSEEEDNEENRKTASLGDLSLPAAAATRTTTAGGTLERAQSLEMSENGQVVSAPHPTAPPKKRKAPVVSDSDLSGKEPRLMVTDLDGMDGQRGRLRSANEWGNLEDAISAKSSVENASSDTESSGRLEESMQGREMDESVSSLVTEVMAVLNGSGSSNEQPEKRIEAEIKEFGVRMIDEVPVKTMEQLLKEKLEEAQAALETDEEEEDSDKKVPLQKINGGGETITTFTTMTTLNGTGDQQPRIATISLKDNIDLSTISPPDSPKMAELSPDTIKRDFERNHLAEEIKVSRFPFGSLERPKSDVLKKVIARKMEDFTTTTTTTTTTTDTPQPVSLTLIGGDSGDDTVIINGGQQPLAMDSNPVYSSDNQGVNSISISSMEVNILPPTLKTHSTLTITTNNTTSEPQPSSIILIEDEPLDFTLKTPPPEMVETSVTVSSAGQSQPPPMPAARNLSGQVFIVDSLSQPKRGQTIAVKDEDEEGDEEGNGEQLSDQDVIDALKTFVTEIDVSDSGAENAAAKLALDSTMKFLEHEKQMASSEARTDPSPPHNDDQHNHHQRPIEVMIPRNTEIKFTTSTYESSPKVNGNERRHSAHVDQIRSNFERQNSEIPVPVRKSSIPTLKLSPSKIPVFNSNGSGGGGGNSNQTSPPTQRYSLTSKSPSPTGSRNVTMLSQNSIKNSARHPSGK